MTVTKENVGGIDHLVIKLPIASNPGASKSGKTLTVCSTNGFAATPVMVNGSLVKVSVNAFIPKN